MKRYARVQFEAGNTRYTYMTIEENLKSGDILLVDTQNGLKTAKFHSYDTSTSAKHSATKWIYKVLCKETLDANLQMELKEEGISYSSFVEQKRYMQAKTMVEDARDRDALERLKVYTDVDTIKEKMREKARKHHASYWDDENKVRW